MKNSCCRFVTANLLLLLFLNANAWGGEDEIRAWLEKMQHAAHTVNYDGTFVYSRQDQLTAMRLIHRADQTGEQERLISLDSSGREVIRDNNKVTCILPDSKAVVVDKDRPTGPFPPPFPSSIKELEKHYQFTLAGQGKVAGQLAQKIYIQPRDQYRYGHRLWIDVNTGLLLQKHLMNEAGKPLEKFMFTRIEYLKKVPDALLKSQNIGKEYTWYEEDDKITMPGSNKQKWVVAWLPAGFKQDMETEHKLPSNGKPLEHLVYSDGLSSISVFIEPHAKKGNHLIGTTTMGAVSANGRHLDNFNITVVGEVPQITVRKVCDSVHMEHK